MYCIILWRQTERAGALQPVEEKALRGSYSGLPVCEGGSRKSREGLFIRAGSNRTKGNGFKLEEGRFRRDIRKKFFTVKVVRHWYRLPSEVVHAHSLVAFKARLDGTLNNLVQREMSQPIAGELELDDLKGPLQYKAFYDSLILNERNEQWEIYVVEYLQMI